MYGDVVSHVNISSVKPEDGGEYECIAENRAGRTSHSARLNIYGLPYVRSMSPISAVAGKDLVVKCPVAGYPIESVIWEKGIEYLHCKKLPMKILLQSFEIVACGFMLDVRLHNLIIKPAFCALSFRILTDPHLPFEKLK